ncbi:MAG: prolyl oligopeptidase family serine peptidase [Planctomycetales bacterium]
MRRIQITSLLLVAAAFPALAQQRKPKKAAVGPSVLKLYEARTFEGMPYRLMKPIDLAENPTQKYPLILSLHGAGGKGAGNIQNLRRWNAEMARPTARRKHPCFVVAPQSAGPWRVPAKQSNASEIKVEDLSTAWRKVIERRKSRGVAPTGVLDKVFKLLDALPKEFNIDTDRVYVLGHSMGGFGSWTSLGEQPSRFAAAIPTAGGLSPRYDVKTFAHVPIWTFHGAGDSTVPTDLTREAFARLKKVGANVKYTELQGVKHGADAAAFVYHGDHPDKGWRTQFASEQCDKTSDVWDWLFAQRRKPRSKP